MPDWLRQEDEDRCRLSGVGANPTLARSGVARCPAVVSLALLTFVWKTTDACPNRRPPGRALSHPNRDRRRRAAAHRGDPESKAGFFLWCTR